MPADGVRPRLFASASAGAVPTGLAGLELEQARKFEALWERAVATSSGTGRRVRRRLEDAGGLVLSMRRLGCAARFPGRTLTSVPPHGLPPPLVGWMMAGICWCFMAVSARESGGVRVIPLGSLTVYKSLLCKRLDRKSRFFGWLLVHGALRSL